jgi:hypothetical protein
VVVDVDVIVPLVIARASEGSSKPDAGDRAPAGGAFHR